MPSHTHTSMRQLNDFTPKGTSKSASCNFFGVLMLADRPKIDKTERDMGSVIYTDSDSLVLADRARVSFTPTHI